MIAIKVENIKKIFYKKDMKITAINDISYEFEYGKIYAIMGHSGSGKSTFVHCLGLLENIDSGDIYINSKNINSLSTNQKNLIKNDKIGFIFQEYYLNNTMKAYENVMLPMLINKKYKDINIKNYSIELLTLFGLKDRINHYPKELSGGEQQRVATARAIANDPDIILADEPTGNLDEENEKFILLQLKEMSKKGKCIIIVSHNNIIKEFADVVINMKNVKFVGDKNEM